MTDFSIVTGPPYPIYAPGFTPGSNSIGTFKIGVSPVGDLSPFNIWTTIISQYANSPRLTGMIEAFNAAMDQTENIDNLYDMIWNIATATGYGLQVWGRIVGVTNSLSFPGTIQFLGNEEANSWTGFGQGILFSGGGTTTNFQLTDTDFRRLILAKAAGNVSDGSIPSLNAILLSLFPLRGNCFVVNNQNMTMTLKFQFPLNPIENAILQQSNVLPYPVGVVVNIVQP
jgi:Protein of unknown function (DUF2612)